MIPKYVGVKPNNKVQLTNPVFTKSSSQVTPSGKAVFGVIMMDQDALPIVLGIIHPLSFSSQANRTIYEAALSLFDKAPPIICSPLPKSLRSKASLI